MSVPTVATPTLSTPGTTFAASDTDCCYCGRAVYRDEEGRWWHLLSAAAQCEPVEVKESGAGEGEGTP